MTTPPSDPSEDEPILAAQRALEPEREGSFQFLGRTVRTATMANGQGFVVMKSLCEAFELSYSGQRQRVYRTEIFRRHSSLVMVQTPSARQPMLCMSAIAVPAFLLGIETARLANETARTLLDAFQEEGMTVLAEHFGLSERGEIRFLRESVARMTLEQEAFEEQIVKNVEKELAADRAAREEKIQQIREAFGHMRDQIRALEKTAGPKQRITPEQLGQLKQTVMVLGELMIRAGENKRPWPAIYTDIMLHFGFARSEDITQEAFPDVLAFLDRQAHAFRELILKQAKEN